ncbi:MULTISPECIES: hypothetical protein [unclassified Pseudodesulfovibrio]|uniref:hypothetical protein n=1 Tax=unclassified Pseudodesulfovibrio TaxID=2661612 RepID=UPI000FEBA9AA|nr:MULTISPECIES: hypothetical protein [unclassified Pseudodesulfovibrio]MCJ2164297.1 hypothetical protein [Pseudodesulfovibrio sp. S3-i]RWU04508.1 hypothetical protein DWB63_07050 [Pseudodesulfovibrio sp. S3]
MAKDFREYLVEASRHELFGRVFKELAIGLKVVVSFQASETHACYPEKTLDDPYEYTRWEVALRSSTPAIDVPKAGAWEYLKHNYWAKPFDKPDFQRALVGENIPTKDCQQILEDVIEYAKLKGHLDSEEEIRVLEPDEEVKKISACGGCGGKKKAAKSAEK